MGVSVVICCLFEYVQICTCDALIQKYGKIVFLQIMISNVAFFKTIEFVVMCKKVLTM